MIQENVNARNKFQIIVLSVKFDTNLTYCNEGSQEIFALSKVASYMSLSKRCILMNVLFSSQFKYCLLVWMCHHSATNGKINRLHERCLSILYNIKHSFFEELLEKHGSVSFHDANIPYQAVEMKPLIHLLSVICLITKIVRWYFNLPEILCYLLFFLQYGRLLNESEYCEGC